MIAEHIDGGPGFEVQVLSPEEWLAAQLGFRGTSMFAVANDIQMMVDGENQDD